MGQLLVGVEGFALTVREQRWLKHPMVGGVVLFSRNYQDPEQLKQLTQSIHLVAPKLLICVDHEGGRVQRFRGSFTELPPAAYFGETYDQDPEQAFTEAYQSAYIMATELKAVGVDLSFAPVLDIGGCGSKVIGDRAFHANPAAVSQLAMAYMEGMAAAEMLAVGKHFPGHGSVVLDTHHECVTDSRTLSDIEALDLVPFQYCIERGLQGVMTSHIIFPKVDTLPVSQSSIWLKKLRKDYGFRGLVFTDDMDMQAALTDSECLSIQRALDAGTDYVLVCNDFNKIDRVLEELSC